MPTYDYRCEKCGNEFEDFLPMAKRAEPTESPCKKDTGTFPSINIGVDEQVVCGGKIDQVPGKTPAAFAYDNIASPGHPKKPPSWMTDKLKEIKKKQAGATMSWHH